MTGAWMGVRDGSTCFLAAAFAHACVFGKFVCVLTFPKSSNGANEFRQTAKLVFIYVGMGVEWYYCGRLSTIWILHWPPVIDRAGFVA